MNKQVSYRAVTFFVLLFVIGALLGGAVLWWRVSENNARVQEAKARQAQAQVAIEEMQPEIIVARSQANINNVVAVGNLKDSAMIVVLCIVLLKDLSYAKIRIGSQSG